MAKRVIMVNGSKGGVGKSLAAMATIDLLLRAGEKVILVESDNTNSDVAKCYGEALQTSLVNLETANGWIEFLDLCHAHPDAIIVVNTRAANIEGLQGYAKMAQAGLRKLRRPFVTLWTLNTQRDSVGLLHDFLELLPGLPVHAVRNLYYGRENEFVEYERSEARAVLEASGGHSLFLPVLASYVTDQMYNERLSIDRAAEVSFGLGLEISRWRELLDSQRSLGRALGAPPAAVESIGDAA